MTKIGGLSSGSGVLGLSEPNSLGSSEAITSGSVFSSESFDDLGGVRNMCDDFTKHFSNGVRLFFPLMHSRNRSLLARSQLKPAFEFQNTAVVRVRSPCNFQLMNESERVCVVRFSLRKR